MRLAVFTNQFPAPLSSFFARDVRALIEAGIEVHVFPIYPLEQRLWTAVPDILDEAVFPRERVHHISPAAALAPAPGPQVRRLPNVLRESLAIGASAVRYGPGPVAKSAYTAVKAWGWARQFPAGSFDHVLAYWGNYAATAAYLYHQLTDPSVPFSMFVHARMDLYQHQVYLAEKLAYADNVFLVCEYNRKFLRAKYPALFPRLEERLHVHHLGLDLADVRFTPAPRPPRTVITVGRLEQLKGVHCLLDAAHLLRGRGITIQVNLVGAGEEEPALRRQARELGIESQVRFLGWMGPDAVIAAMREATLLVHPSVRPDAMPTVVKEAIAVGTPVVASDLAGIPEMLDHGRCGVLVPPGDVPALAKGIERLLGDEAQRQQFSALARQHAEQKFDLWTNGRRLAERLRTTAPRYRTNGREVA